MIFEGNRYSRKGFLFKSFAMSAVVRKTLQTHCELGFVLRAGLDKRVRADLTPRPHKVYMKLCYV